jgi:hypothetical protein
VSLSRNAPSVLSSRLSPARPASRWPRRRWWRGADEAGGPLGGRVRRVERRACAAGERPRPGGERAPVTGGRPLRPRSAVPTCGELDPGSTKRRQATVARPRHATTPCVARTGLGFVNPNHFPTSCPSRRGARVERRGGAPAFPFDAVARELRSWPPCSSSGGNGATRHGLPQAPWRAGLSADGVFSALRQKAPRALCLAPSKCLRILKN